jgi:hypothetical protein
MSNRGRKEGVIMPDDVEEYCEFCGQSVRLPAGCDRDDYDYVTAWDNHYRECSSRIEPSRKSEDNSK